MPTPEIDAKMKILLAAKELMAYQGYQGTSVRQICEKAGVNIAMISYHFGGKEKVFNAILETFLPIDRMKQYEQTLSDPVNGLKLIIQEVTLFGMQDPEMIMIFHQEIVMKTERMGEIRNRMIPLWTRLRDLLKEGREQGVFQFRSLDHTLLFVIGSILFHKQAEYFKPLYTENDKSVDEMIENLTNFILSGLQYSK